MSDTKNFHQALAMSKATADAHGNRPPNDTLLALV
jgi:hypothetical protein